MDNELTNAVSEAAESTSSSFSKYLPVGGGFLAGMIGGVVLDRFVIRPLIKKYKEKKAEKEAKSEEKKTAEE